MFLNSCILVGYPALYLAEGSIYRKSLDQDDPRAAIAIGRVFAVNQNSHIVAFENLEEKELYVSLPEVYYYDENVKRQKLDPSYVEMIEAGTQFTIKKVTVGASYLLLGGETSNAKRYFAQVGQRNFLVDVSWFFYRDIEEANGLKPKSEYIREVNFFEEF
jgi:hypothetical protein